MEERVGGDGCRGDAGPLVVAAATGGRELIAVDVEVAMAHVFEVFTADGRYRPDDLRNVYLFGSRLYGVATPDADYDLICIVEGEYFHGAKQYEETRQLLTGTQDETKAGGGGGGGEIEVTLNLYHIQFFRGLVRTSSSLSSSCLRAALTCACAVCVRAVCAACAAGAEYDQQLDVSVHAAGVRVAGAVAAAGHGGCPPCPGPAEGRPHGLLPQSRQSQGMRPLCACAVVRVRWCVCVCVGARGSAETHRVVAHALSPTVALRSWNLQRLWFEGDTRKSKKNIVHGLRYLHYGVHDSFLRFMMVRLGAARFTV
jgi:hypothetical protein